MNGFCSKCRDYLPPEKGVIRCNEDGIVELICDRCIEAEYVLSKRLPDMSVSNHISIGIVKPGRSCAFG
jgi:RNase P subunit RPR2